MSGYPPTPCRVPWNTLTHAGLSSQCPARVPSVLSTLKHASIYPLQLHCLAKAQLAESPGTTPDPTLALAVLPGSCLCGVPQACSLPWLQPLLQGNLCVENPETLQFTPASAILPGYPLRTEHRSSWHGHCPSSSGPARAHPASNALRHPSLHPLQLQLSCNEHLLHRALGFPGLNPASGPATFTGHPLCRESCDSLAYTHFGFNYLPWCPLGIEPQNHLACTHFRFSCPVRDRAERERASEQRASESPRPTPTSALAILAQPQRENKTKPAEKN